MYQTLNQPSPEVFLDRVANLEAYALALQTAGLLGSHIYAAGVVPAATTTGTDTFGVAGQIFLCELRIGHNTLLTGLSYLIGSVGGTDKAIALLFDANGNVVATSALAGTTVGTLATFQRLAFTTAYQAAPGLYYVGIQLNGVTAKIRTQVFGDHNTGVVAQTFGTPVAVTTPTSFTTATAPIVMTY